QVDAEAASVWERPSIFVVAPVKKGEAFSSRNIRIIRPGGGLLPKYYDRIIGLTAAADIDEATPLKAEMVAGQFKDPSG
ncbi:MAG: hypothetical protein JNK21_01655, partial [Rhodospirillaceae bacterium]|nr:hypothetical protein [Rhodospirillaceae bacterium]